MKIRTSPRISVNKLGEYLLAAPARRQEIIRDQKFPPVFKSARYRVASAVVCDFLASGASDWSALTAAASSLRESVRFSKLKEADIALNIEALTCFMQFYGKVSLHGADVQVQKLPTASLSIGGVEVSISRKRPVKAVRSRLAVAVRRPVQVVARLQVPALFSTGREATAPRLCGTFPAAA